MIKIGVAVGALVIAAGLIAWTMLGGGGSGPETTPPPPPTPEQQQMIDQQTELRQQNPATAGSEAGA
ncbi:MAG: hypothetical protein R3B68_04135 [Phycisphaerales bacterium]